jgi:hypothetical protein
LAAVFGFCAPAFDVTAFDAVVPLLALRDAASAIATHFQLSIPTLLWFLNRRSTN